MTRMIWKFVLEVTDIQEIKMPIGAKILSVEFQGDNLCLWAIVNPEEDTEIRTFLTYGAGRMMTNENVTHLATVQQPPFIWHVFEEIGE